MQIQSANDLLDSSVEEVPPQLANNPSTFVPTNPMNNKRLMLVTTKNFFFKKRQSYSNQKGQKKL